MYLSKKQEKKIKNTMYWQGMCRNESGVLFMMELCKAAHLHTFENYFRERYHYWTTKKVEYKKEMLALIEKAHKSK